MAKVKKVDEKMVVKTEVMAIVTKALADAGVEVFDGTDYGFTKGTVVARMDFCDVQLKPITPKTGVVRYEVVAEDE